MVEVDGSIILEGPSEEGDQLIYRIPTSAKIEQV